jgi:hypothetical protein
VTGKQFWKSAAYVSVAALRCRRFKKSKLEREASGDGGCLVNSLICCYREKPDSTGLLFDVGFAKP